MAGELGGWFRKLLGRGSKGANGAAVLSKSNGNGNGTKLPPSKGRDIRILAKRAEERERSALIIQEGIRDLSGLLKGIESRLETQNNQGSAVRKRLESLAETLRSLPNHGEESKAILESIQKEVLRQGETGREVAGYFRTIPEILESLEAGGSNRKTQLELARGLVREVVSQGQKLTAVSRSAAQMANTMGKLTKIGEAQLACLRGVEEGIRSGFQSAGEAQLKAQEEWKRRNRWMVIGGITFLAVAALALGAGILMNLTLTQGVIGELLATPSVQRTVEIPETPAAPKPGAEEAPADLPEVILPEEPMMDSAPEHLFPELYHGPTGPVWTPWVP